MRILVLKSIIYSKFKESQTFFRKIILNKNATIIATTTTIQFQYKVRYL